MMLVGEKTVRTRSIHYGDLACCAIIKNMQY